MKKAVETEIKVLEYKDVDKEQLSIIKEVKKTNLDIEFVTQDEDVIKDQVEENIVKREVYKTTSQKMEDYKATNPNPVIIDGGQNGVVQSVM